MTSESDLIREWKAIAQELGVAERTAQRLATKRKDPLPVYVDHRGVVVHRIALREWVYRQRMAYVVARSQSVSHRRRKKAKRQGNNAVRLS